MESGRIAYHAHEAVCELFHAPDHQAQRVWGKNVAERLNLALRALLRPGDYVVTSSREHNSMMRPLRALEGGGVAITVVGCSPQGMLDPAGVEAAVQSKTRLVALNHTSNVAGTLLPVADAGNHDWDELAAEYGVMLMQGLGVMGCKRSGQGQARQRSPALSGSGSADELAPLGNAPVDLPLAGQAPAVDQQPP